MCCGPLAKFLEMFAETSRLWWSASPSDAPRAVRWTGAISCHFPRSAYLWSRWSWASRRKRSTNWHGMKEETSSAGLCARRLESTVRVTWPCCRHTCWNDTVNICTGLYYFVCVCVDTWQREQWCLTTLMFCPFSWGWDNTAATLTWARLWLIQIKVQCFVFFFHFNELGLFVYLIVQQHNIKSMGLKTPGPQATSSPQTTCGWPTLDVSLVWALSWASPLTT